MEIGGKQRYVDKKKEPRQYIQMKGRRLGVKRKRKNYVEKR